VKLTQEQQQAQHFIHFLIKKCWENLNFKKKLIEDPITTIETIIGKPNNLPEGTHIHVEDQSDPEIIYFNIPPKPTQLK